MKGNFDGSSEQGERGESSISEAINGILTNGNLELFPVAHGELEAELSKVQRLSSLEDEELGELLKMLRGLKVSIDSATHALKEGRAYFGVAKGHPKNLLWGNEKIVMERTHALVAKNEQVALIFDIVRAEDTKRQRAKTFREREAVLEVYEKVFEGLSREQILEKLLEYMETLLRLQDEIASLEKDLDYDPDDVMEARSNLANARKTLYETQTTIDAGKKRIGKK